MSAKIIPALKTSIRYNDIGSYWWLWTHAPCSWKGNVELQFANVPLGCLQPAGSLIDPAVVASQMRRMQTGRALAPPVVCATGSGAWYIHDGNHRYHAMRIFLSGNEEASVRVAIAVPHRGVNFRHRWFGSYGTYSLEPVVPLLSTSTAGPFQGRTLVLVAHPDDETVCAGLLQRLDNPVVAYATNGAPTDKYFWGKYGSRESYAVVRQKEAKAALANVKLANVDFLYHYAPKGVEFRDQQLYRVLREAFEAVSDLVRRYQPGVVLVPAYEGGHPDHDGCSFLGALLRRHFRLSVWEMPLYHRSKKGRLVCQQFRTSCGSERAVMLSKQEKQVRGRMIASYASQSDVADFVSADVELYRPQTEYDYSRPPHPGPVNYEVWHWPISPNEVCQAFQGCTRPFEEAQPICPAARAPGAQGGEAAGVFAEV